jgi:3-methyl-2-oxobutanoate hydroxymethyltransferase
VSVQSRTTVKSLSIKKQRGEKITVLTAYDYPISSFANKAGIDIILVSDAVGTVGLGRQEAVSVTVDEMIYHTKACRNGAETCLVVTTLPFGSYSSALEAINNATRIMKEGNADAVHLEGTASDSTILKSIVDSGIPVMAHIGVIKQKIVRSGSIEIQGRNAADAIKVISDACALAEAGAFAILLECLPAPLGEVITRTLSIPTIGIGSGNACDGQALVTQDMLGLYKKLSPRFLKVYADLESVIVDAFKTFRREVENGLFPGPEHTYSIQEDELIQLLTLLPEGSGRR